MKYEFKNIETMRYTLKQLVRWQEAKDLLKETVKVAYKSKNKKPKISYDEITTDLIETIRSELKKTCNNVLQFELTETIKIEVSK